MESLGNRQRGKHAADESQKDETAVWWHRQRKLKSAVPIASAGPIVKAICETSLSTSESAICWVSMLASNSSRGVGAARRPAAVAHRRLKAAGHVRRAHLPEFPSRCRRRVCAFDYHGLGGELSRTFRLPLKATGRMRRAYLPDSLSRWRRRVCAFERYLLMYVRIPCL